MSDDGSGIVFILFKEFLSTGKCNLVDVFVDIFGGHAYSVVADGKSAGFFVHSHFYIHLSELSLEFAKGREGLELLSRVDSIAHELAKENLMVGIEKLLDYRKNIIGGNSDFTFLYS